MANCNFRTPQDVIELLEGVKMEKLPVWANDDRPTSCGFPRGIRLFLASSSELREDRDEFDLYFRRYNDQLTRKGIYLEIVRCEHFLDAISETRLQDEYNKGVRDCDIFVSCSLPRRANLRRKSSTLRSAHSRKKANPESSLSSKAHS